MLYNYESENLTYEILSDDAAPFILEFYLANRELFEPYEPDKPSGFYTLEYQAAMAKLEYENFLRGKSARFWLQRKTQPGIIIGCVSFNNIVKGSFQYCTIGYKIHKSHMGLGYATEAVHFLTQTVCTQFGMHRVEAYIHPDNSASIALAEKCGFTFDGISKEYVYMKGAWVDHLRYTYIHHDPSPLVVAE